MLKVLLFAGVGILLTPVIAGAGTPQLKLFSGDRMVNRQPFCSYMTTEQLTQTAIGDQVLQLRQGMTPNQVQATITIDPPSEPYSGTEAQEYGWMRWTWPERQVELSVGFQNGRMTNDVELSIRKCEWVLELGD